MNRRHLMLMVLQYSSLAQNSGMSSTTLVASIPEYTRGPSAHSDIKFDSCVCCCENLHEVGIGPCNHPVACGLCNARLRLLMNETSCIMCKQAIDPLIITKHKELDFNVLMRNCMQSLHLEDISDMGILIDDDNFSKKMLFLQSFRCSVCQESLSSMESLQGHVRKAHGMTFCQLCLDNRKVFPQEQVPSPACDRARPPCTSAPHRNPTHAAAPAGAVPATGAAGAPAQRRRRSGRTSAVQPMQQAALR
jgi:hypothetical protein